MQCVSVNMSISKCYANVDNRNGREQTEEPAKA